MISPKMAHEPEAGHICAPCCACFSEQVNCLCTALLHMPQCFYKNAAAGHGFDIHAKNKDMLLTISARGSSRMVPAVPERKVSMSMQSKLMHPLKL